MDMLNLCQNTPKVKTVYGTGVSLRDAQGQTAAHDCNNAQTNTFIDACGSIAFNKIIIQTNKRIRFVLQPFYHSKICLPAR